MDCPLFQGLPKETVEAELEALNYVSKPYQKGEVLYSPHAFSRSLGILLRGTVSVTRGSLPVSVLRPGELFGAAALYNQRPDYVTTLTARTDCEVLFLSQEDLDTLMARQSQVGKNYIAYLSERIRFLSGKLEELGPSTAEGRVVRYLMLRNQEGRTLPDCSLTELAGRLGMGRATLYRVLDALEREGMLHREGKTIVWTGYGKDEENEQKTDCAHWGGGPDLCSGGGMRR